MLTKLDAVNQILEVIDEPPVPSLESGLPDAEDAERTLDRISLEVQAKGWEVNTDYDYEFQPNANGEITVPANILRIEPIDKRLSVTVKVIDNLRFLYDRKARTTVFDRPIKCLVVWGYDFEELTYELQAYITARASRVFQEQSMGSVSLDSFARRREQEAYAALLDAESEMDEVNTLRDNSYVRYVTGRYNPLSGR